MVLSQSFLHVLIVFLFYIDVRDGRGPKGEPGPLVMRVFTFFLNYSSTLRLTLDASYKLLLAHAISNISQMITFG